MRWLSAHRRRLFAAVLAATAAGAAIPLAGVDADPSTRRAAWASAALGPGQACGAGSAAAIAAVDATAARKIYEDELAGTETRLDLARIGASAALSRALAESNVSGVRAAVHALVYAPGWHIVRLRVLDNRGHVLADIGGPYIIAPVRGTIRSGGRKVGSFVMSVQDDLGFEKLVTRFIGVPLELYYRGAPIMGTIHPLPAFPVDGALVTVGGHSYLTRVLTAPAFPSGTLRVALYIPVPGAATAGRGCAAVTVGAWGSIARHIAARFTPLSAHYRDLVSVLRAITGGPAFVQSHAQRVAGGGSPTKLPARGTVHYGGRAWSVYSWSPQSQATVYLLTRPG